LNFEFNSWSVTYDAIHAKITIACGEVTWVSQVFSDDVFDASVYNSTVCYEGDPRRFVPVSLHIDFFEGGWECLKHGEDCVQCKPVELNTDFVGITHPETEPAVYKATTCFPKNKGWDVYLGGFVKQQ
jgi:hypothetical protein